MPKTLLEHPQTKPSLSADLERLTAIRHTLEAWEAAEGDQIPQDVLATAFLYTATSYLTEFYGEHKTLQVIRRLREQVSSGEFSEETVKAAREQPL